MKKILILAVLLFALLAFSDNLAYGQQPAPEQVTPPILAQANGTAKIAPEVQKAMQSLRPGEMLTVIVTLADQADLKRLAGPIGLNRAARQRGVIETLRAKAASSQKVLKALLTLRQAERRAGEVTYFWIFNGLAVTATPAVIQELAARPEVLKITPNETIQAPPLLSEKDELGSLSVQPNLALINVSALWDLGYRGQGIVVANLDTGVDGSHPDLAPKWRGGTNSWFDPYNQHPTTPTDLAGSSSGHGTRTMGIMVGGEHNGTGFGIAPESQWIAAKVFKDDGSGTTAGFHAAFQWLLNPDGNAATPDAPDVVNNSWTYGNPNSCNLEFQPDLQALRAAGILPIFAAGNAGFGSTTNPAPTSQSPGNLPEALAVGGINNSSAIYSSSNRGPSACDGTIFPEVVAPGVSVHTTDRFGLYTNATGTSFAAPHAAAALALLLDAYPAMSVAEQETILLNSAVELGPPAGPDNSFGRGRIDLLAGYESLFDLSVTQSSSASSLMAETPLSYTLTIANGGPFTATSVTLSDTLPAKAAFGGVTFSQGNCTGTSTITCAFGNLTSGAVATVTVSITPTQAGLLINTVNVAGARSDLNAANNTSTAQTTVIGQSFLPMILK